MVCIRCKVMTMSPKAQIVAQFIGDSKLVVRICTFINGKSFKLFAIAPINHDDRMVEEDLNGIDWGDWPYQAAGDNWEAMDFVSRVEPVVSLLTEEELQLYPYYLGKFSQYYNWVDMTIAEYTSLGGASAAK